MVTNDIKAQSIFIGELKLTNKTISFQGTTILVSNISKYDTYEATRRNSISILMMGIAGLAIIIFIRYMYWGLIFVLPGALIIYLGIKERQRPTIYGVRVELNSGMRYYFSSINMEGIKSLYASIGKVIHNDGPMNQIVNFNGSKIEFNSGDTYNVNNSQAGSIGRNASGNTTFNNATGDSSSAAL